MTRVGKILLLWLVIKSIEGSFSIWQNFEPTFEIWDDCVNFYYCKRPNNLVSYQDWAIFESYCQISSKRSPNDWQLFGLFWITSLLCKNCIGYFLGNCWKNWASFYSNILSHWLEMSRGERERFARVSCIIPCARFTPEMSWKKVVWPPTSNKKSNQHKLAFWSASSPSSKVASSSVFASLDTKEFGFWGWHTKLICLNLELFGSVPIYRRKWNSSKVHIKVDPTSCRKLLKKTFFCLFKTYLSSTLETALWLSQCCALLFYCCTVVLLQLHCCCAIVALCYSTVVQLLYCCYSIVALLLCCFFTVVMHFCTVVILLLSCGIVRRDCFANRQCLWLSWQGCRFFYQRSAVQLQSSAKFYVEQLTVKKTKVKIKEADIGPFFKKMFRWKLICFVRFSAGQSRRRFIWPDGKEV